jgi:hypothetical protein
MWISIESNLECNNKVDQLDKFNLNNKLNWKLNSNGAHLINKIINKHRTNVVPNSNECSLDFGVSIFKPNDNIKTHPTFKPIIHLLRFWFFIKLWIEMPFTH